ncbi:HPr kinase [Methylocella silvestris BL2]|uniref:HPr kinase n=1 Tax=Methylocella silvestris (strain DSM 15510 / CIP 108128 / LMG 27833 / NCIMB 13906 / BL2) TaxID=395965 RepID=B8ENZ5_METSB|nr:HPr kinase/phosphatase C-terminal domain-containing protein [Methylocella silvestris]ACK49233.1 HPr kinase [Methylocella silvestris BL2]
MAAARLSPATEPREALNIHASAIVIQEAGVLIRGASGAGKSSLALALIQTAANAGLFARLVGDDRIEVSARHGRLIARGHKAILGRIEQRGVGILERPYLSAAVIRLIVDLVPPDEAPRLPDAARGLGAEPKTLEPCVCDDWDFRSLEQIAILGVRLPRVRLPDHASAADLALAILQRFRCVRSGD